MLSPIFPGFRLESSNTNTIDIDEALLSTLGSKSSNKTGTFPTTKFLNREKQFTAIPLRNSQGKHTIGKLFGSRLRIIILCLQPLGARGVKHG